MGTKTLERKEREKEVAIIKNHTHFERMGTGK